MRKVALYGTTTVVISAAINLLHTASHAGQHVMNLPGWQLAYIAVVIYAVPVVAAVLLWTRYRLAGAWLLLASMAGSFVFDLAYHFLIPGPDNVFTLQPGAWMAPFWVSAALLQVVSGVGSLVGGWAVKVLSRHRAGVPSIAGRSGSRRGPRTGSR